MIPQIVGQNVIASLDQMGVGLHEIDFNIVDIAPGLLASEARPRHWHRAIGNDYSFGRVLLIATPQAARHRPMERRRLHNQ